MMRRIKISIVSVLLFFSLACIGNTGVFAENNTDTSTVQENQDGLSNSMELHSFYPAFINYSQEMEKYIDACDSISFAWSRLYQDDLSKLGTVKGAHGNYGFYYPSDYLQPVLYAKSRGKSIQLSIYADSGCSNTVLPYPETRLQVLNTIITALNTDLTQGQSVFYDGVVIDFEGLKDIDKNGNDILINGQHISYYFDAFLSELKAELDKYGKKLYVAVNPSLYFNGYDYEGIIKTADRMIVMAHDYEPAGKLKKSDIKQYSGYDSLNPIDSPAPADEVRLALNEIKTRIPDPSDLKRVMIQLCFDCKQWRFPAASMEDWEVMPPSTLSKEGALTVFYNKLKARVDNLDGSASNISYSYNNELHCPVIQYLNTTDKTYNTIVYEDSNSISNKLKMFKAYGMGGVSIWSLGNIPDYNDDNGKAFHLDVWDNLIAGISGQGTEVNSEDNIVQFSDPVIENAVRTKLGMPQGDIKKSDVEGIYRLKLPANTTNLSDLNLLTNLEYLDAQALKIKDVSALRDLKNLKVLKLQNNLITDISPLSALKNLQILNLTANKISDISPLGDLNLEELYISNNLIGNVAPLKRNIGLKALYMDTNKISDMNPLASLKNLYWLSAEGNNIARVNALSGLSKLRYLDLASNKIADISPLKTLKKLNTLYLQRNLIRDITYLKENTSLKELSLNGNKISNLKSISGLNALEKLYLKDNLITSVSYLKFLKKLNTLYLGGNKIRDLSSLKGIYENLKYLDF